MKKILFTSLSILLLAAACNKQAVVQPAQNQQVNLVSPAAPALSYFPDLANSPAYVQIIWNYDVSDYSNIYRSTVQNNWQKIQNNYRNSAHAAVDSDFPKDAKVLYYRITSTDGKGNESQPSPTSSVNLDETANWKTYTNSQYGFEVKYPSDYILQSDSGSEPFDMAKKNNVVFQKGASAVMVTIEPAIKTLEEYLKNLTDARSKAYEGYPSVEVLKSEKTTLANKQLIRDEVSYIAAALYGIENHIDATPQMVIRIGVRGEHLDDALRNLNNQILLTFKFTK